MLTKHKLYALKRKLSSIIFYQVIKILLQVFYTFLRNSYINRSIVRESEREWERDVSV